MSTPAISVNLPVHGEVGYDAKLNAAIQQLLAALNTLQARVDTVEAAPASDLVITDNGDGTLNADVIGPDVTVVDNGDGTLSLTVLQPAALTVVDNGDGTLEVTP